MFSVTREVGIEAEGLGEIAGLRARVARRLAEDLRDCPRVASITPARIWKVEVLPAPSGPIRPKISPVCDFEVDAANSLDRAVALRDRDPDGRCDACVRASRSPVSDRRVSFRRLASGHVSPCARISPSAGMPGFANPIALFSCSLTPTTCFTRSSRK